MDIRYEVVTNLSKIEVRSRLEASLKNEGFGILWELNMKDKLQEKGLTFDRDFIVLEVCNPVAAKKVLDIDISAGYFLPCKMAIYEEEGNLVLGLIRPTTLIALQENPALESLAKEVEEALILAISNVVK
ncbi:MAG: hypothetical protein CVU95_13380 [Firmicutes bacterium HGW-Firmicutes-2]|jgi:uncharacterized protein (DUF302 family)|nr:MAG: hypothetical protein CVU95_13380 [Firmicutes bacterium HGW-Firmicutes-2]